MKIIKNGALFVQVKIHSSMISIKITHNQRKERKINNNLEQATFFKTSFIYFLDLHICLKKGPNHYEVSEIQKLSDWTLGPIKAIKI